MKDLTAITNRLGEALENRLDLTKQNKNDDLQVQHDAVKALLKDVTDDLKPIKEAVTVLKGYLAEVDAIKENKQLSIFDV